MEAAVNRALKLAWSDYSKIVRMEEATLSGVCTCVACGNNHLWDAYRGLMQAGHFYPARSNTAAIKFLRINVHPQCRRCNAGGIATQYNPNAARAVEDANRNYRHWMEKHYDQSTIEGIRDLDKRQLDWTAESAAEFRAKCMDARKRIESARKNAVEWNIEEAFGHFAPVPEQLELLLN